MNSIRYWKTNFEILLYLAPLFLQTACSDVRLAKREGMPISYASQGEFCTEPPAKLGLYTKVMFVVDKSGSNVSGNNGGPGTDPEKQIRGGAIEGFFNNHRDNEYIRWSFVVFNDGNAESYIPEQGGPNLIFTGDTSLVDAAIERFKSTADLNATPYKAALNLVRSAVIADQQKDKEIDQQSTYIIIFMSDGYPTDYYVDPGMGGEINMNAILTDVDNLVATSSGRVFLNTIYYGPPDGVAEIILEKMAERGYGRYQKSGPNGEMDLEDLMVAGNSEEPFLIKRLLVYNLSGSPCESGRIGPDSDGDGLCDEDEAIFNQRYAGRARLSGKKFDPLNRNSFSPNFSDLYYLKYVQGEALPTCDGSDLSDEDFDLANVCEERFLFNANPQGPTVEWTNEMIKRSHDGDRKNFDSDGDGILDGLEFLFFKNKSSPLNFNNIFEKLNGRDLDSMITNHLHPLRPGTSIPYAPNFTFVRKNLQGQSCYTYNQANLPLYSTQAVAVSGTGGNLDLAHGTGENVVLVYYIQAPEYAPNSSGYLRFSYQKLKIGRDGPGSIKLTPAIYSLYPKD